MARYLFNEAKKYLVGGVNSPVRSFKAVGGNPIFIKEAKGSKVYSEDGKEYIDYCQSFGAIILGHSRGEVVKEAGMRISKGSCFGASTKQEVEFAKIIIKAIPSIEALRLTNSGTEAVMTAIRLARAFSKKDKIVRFIGSYHGHADYLLDNKAIPKDFTKHTLSVPFNDIEETEQLVNKYYKYIAAVIVEPIAGNIGVVLPKDDFLSRLRKITNKYNILLIFDEVITGFRFTFGGAQNLFGIKPDLTCLGKIIGGGLPIGAVGGERKIMKRLAPEGDVYQSGTFSGNPVSVGAGLAALKVLSENSLYQSLEVKGRELCEGIRRLAEEYKINLKLNFFASMFSLFFTDKEVTDYNSAKFQDKKKFAKFYHGLLKEGVYLAPSGFEADFLSTAHTSADIKITLNAMKKVFKGLTGG